MRVKHKTEGYKATVDEVRRNGKDEIILIHIPLLGWKLIKEFEVIKDETDII